MLDDLLRSNHASGRSIAQPTLDILWGDADHLGARDLIVPCAGDLVMALLDLVDDIVRVEFVDMVGGQLCAQVGGAEVAEGASMVVSWSWGVVHNDGFAAILVFVLCSQSELVMVSMHKKHSNRGLS